MEKYNWCILETVKCILKVLRNLLASYNKYKREYISKTCKNDKITWGAARKLVVTIGIS